MYVHIVYTLMYVHIFVYTLMYVYIFGYLVNKLEMWWVYLSPIEKICNCQELDMNFRGPH